MNPIKTIWRKGKNWTVGSWRFLREEPARLGVIGIAFGAGILAGLPPAQAAFNYTWRDPDFCDDCHVHDYANEAYWRSAHAHVAVCHDCHKVPVMHYPIELYGLIFHEYNGPEDFRAPKIQAVDCYMCHLTNPDHVDLTGPMTDDLLDKVVKIDGSPLHVAHMNAESRWPTPQAGGPKDPQGDPVPLERTEHDLRFHNEAQPTVISCQDCHGAEDNRAHRFEARRDNCLSCHTEIEQAEGRLAAVECYECHYKGFAGGEVEEGEQPINTGGHHH